MIAGEAPAGPIPPVTERHVYIWEFKVSPEREREFLEAYVSAGPWSRLFRKAPGYLAYQIGDAT